MVDLNYETLLVQLSVPSPVIYGLASCIRDRGAGFGVVGVAFGVEGVVVVMGVSYLNN